MWIVSRHIILEYVMGLRESSFGNRSLPHSELCWFWVCCWHSWSHSWLGWFRHHLHAVRSTWFNSQEAILSAGERNTARECQTSGIGAAGDVPAGALYTSIWQENSHPQVIPPSDSVRQHLVKPFKKKTLKYIWESHLKNLDQRYYAHRVLRFGLWQQLLVLCWPWKVPPVTLWNTMLTRRSWSMLT